MALSCCSNVSALLKGIASNHVGDFYCLNCFHSFRTKNVFKNMKKYSKTMSIVM